MQNNHFTTVCLFMCTIALGVLYLIASRELETVQSELERTKVDLQTNKSTLEFTNQCLSETETKLLEVEKELEEFKKPIEYGVAAAPIYDIPLSEELQQYTYDTCLVYGIEDYYEVVLAVMWKESAFDTDVISNGNYGLMQINYVNHDWLVDTLGLTDVLSPRNNIECGVYLLSSLIDKYEDTHMALMAYNMGEGGASEQWARGNYSSYYSNAILAKAESIKADNY